MLYRSSWAYICPAKGGSHSSGEIRGCNLGAFLLQHVEGDRQRKGHNDRNGRSPTIVAQLHDASLR